jgi:uncharacterized repeat protein (TIGR03803 family)
MAATLKTLVSFDGADGSTPESDLIADSSGDLFGTTSSGGANSDGTVFEIAKTAGGYASTPTTVVSFNGADGAFPSFRLLADATGDLFGTTELGGANGDGTVFEIAKAAGGYASTPTTLVSFDGANGSGPLAGLIADAKGDLFGTTEQGGAIGVGTVFEIAKTPTGYASTSTTLVSFNRTDGVEPVAGLIADSNGDLFGMTEFGGAFFLGTVFEIKKTGAGYASTPATLVNLGGADGAGPVASLIADADGDLFGTTSGILPNGFPITDQDGTVFEIKKTAGGYASTPTTLVSFNGTNGAFPESSLIADANGDLFGTTAGESSFNGTPISNGTVFEIKKTAAGYASAPTTLISFNGADGASPFAGLIADASGDLFGTTAQGGANNEGTVFEITDSGFVTTLSATPASNGILFWNIDGQASIWGMDGTNVIAGGPVNPNPGPSWYTVGTGDFNDDGLPDILWQNDDGRAAIWEMDGTNVIGGGAVGPNPGPDWYAIGAGDFNDDGHSDILWQNASSGQASIWEMNGNKIIGGGPVSPNPGPSWRAIGTGDFNDDGHADILWQNADGQAAIWEMNGNKIIGGGPVSPNPGPSWRAIGTGDFNDDGHSDILWQNANGQASIWEMNGNKLIGGGPVSPNPGPSWFAVGIGDFNGDGHSDIVWQNTSWQVAIWDMNGTKIIGGGAVSTNPGPSWYAIGLT